MSEPPRRLHPASPLLDLVTLGRQALVPLVVVVLPRPALALPAVVVLALVVGGLRFVAWQRHTYAVVDGALVVEKGILNRERKVVPVGRVQQVDLQRKLRHQVLGLAVVRIDTAGGGDEAEVVLDAVSDAEAERLRHVLGQRVAAVPEAEVPAAPADDVLVALPYGRLALAGVTGTRLLVVFAVLGTLYGYAADASGWMGRDGDDLALDVDRPAGLVLAALVAGGLVLWLASAAGSAILADAGFTLVRRGDRLHVRRGLLDQREATLAVHRIQAVRVQDNPLRRALGLASVSFQSAGGQGSVDGEDARVTVPLLARSEVPALLAAVLPEAHPGPLRPAPPAARRRSWVRHLVPGAVVAAGGTVAVAAGAPAPLLALLAAVPLALVLGELAYRGLGWAPAGDHLVARRGALVRETVVVPTAKVQSTRVVASPFQRRAGLATLLVDVAGRGRTPAVIDAVADEVAPLRRALLRAPAAHRDERSVRARTAQVRSDTPAARG